MSKFCSRQCPHFSSLRTEFDPRDWQYLYVKRYGGHLLGHVGSFRSLRSPPTLMTPRSNVHTTKRYQYRLINMKACNESTHGIHVRNDCTLQHHIEHRLKLGNMRTGSNGTYSELYGAL